MESVRKSTDFTDEERIEYLFQEFYMKLTRTIEVTKKDGNLLKIHFPEMAYGHFFGDEQLNYMIEHIDRSNPETKVSSIIEMGRRFEYEMFSYYKFYNFFNFPVMRYLYHHQAEFRIATSLFVLYLIYYIYRLS